MTGGGADKEDGAGAGVGEEDEPMGLVLLC